MRMVKGLRMKLRSVIILLVCIVVLMSLLLTDLLVSNSTEENVRNQKAEKATDVAKIVANSSEVRKGLAEKNSEDIQAYTNSIQEELGVLFIVVMNMDGIRQSHPNEAKIGEHFEGGDEKKALQGERYTSVAKGTLDESLRAFVPIYNERSEQIGAVAVGISLAQVEQAVQEDHRRILIGSLFGLLVGIIGAVLLATYIKRTLFGLEPSNIAKILEERSMMLQSVREGVLAIDKEGTITLANKSAVRLFKKAGLSGRPIGLKIADYMPGSRLEEVLSTGESHYDEEQVVNGISIVVNRVPLLVDGEAVGALSTFRDKTEVNVLAEQLTGVKTYVEALRAQSHEFMNKLHVILGMVQMGYHDELSKYIHELVDHRYGEVNSVTKQIKDLALAGFLMGKMSYAREEQVQLSMEVINQIPEPQDSQLTHHLITIIGNLVDNGIDAVKDNKKSKKVGVVLKYENERLAIEVSDNGYGMSSDKLTRIFEKGFSTKGANRGFGLYLVKQSIDALQGELMIDSFVNSGTTFSINLIYKGRVEQHD